MNSELEILLVTAASIGFIHTIIGPDHYIPFIMLAKASKWSRSKTILITVISGMGHVLSSVVIGLVGIAFGIALSKLNMFESFRGNIAGYMLIAFGLIYTLYGIRKAIRDKPHSHSHIHYDGNLHAHDHSHDTHEHFHTHEEKDTSKIKFWTIFAIFVFGPCEPLIPIIMYPAAKSSILGMILVTVVFGIVTIGTMLTIVMLSLKGINMLPFGKLEKYMDAIAGVVILISGISIQIFSL